MQTSIGTKCIAKIAESEIKQSTILAYGTDDGKVKTAGAGETKFIGIAMCNGDFSSPVTENAQHTQPGMVVDVVYAGIAQCYIGSPAPEYGGPVTSDKGGNAIAATTGQMAIGICDKSASPGSLGRVRIQIHKV